MSKRDIVADELIFLPVYRDHLDREPVWEDATATGIPPRAYFWGIGLSLILWLPIGLAIYGIVS